MRREVEVEAEALLDALAFTLAQMGKREWTMWKAALE